jgi:hypothetical protein
MFRSVSITTWFRLPDQGMKNYEFLSRGTAFAVNIAAILDTVSKATDPLLFVSAKHATHPFLCRHVYKEEWLQYVCEENVLRTVELCEEGTGDVIMRSVLDVGTFAHVNWDASVMRLSDQGETIKQLHKAGLELEVHKLAGRRPQKGETVRIDGHVAADRSNNAVNPAAATIPTRRHASSDAISYATEQAQRPLEIFGQVARVAEMEMQTAINETSSNFAALSDADTSIPSKAVACTLQCLRSVPPGMSGAPVIADAGDGVIGMIVGGSGDSSEQNETDNKTAEFIESWALVDMLLDLRRKSRA